jgi:hypothetical protein
VIGAVHDDRPKRVLSRFEVAGVGRAWGNQMHDVRREVRRDQYPWLYGITCELVTGDAPPDRIPPYNLRHYNSAGPYFGSR